MQGASCRQHLTESIVLQEYANVIRDMRKSFFTFVLLFTTVLMSAQDKTLRVDYILSGTDKTQEIAVYELLSFDGWAGRRVNMDSAAVKG